MLLKSHVIKVARSYINTPWVHHARFKGIAIDCLGLVKGVIEESGVPVVLEDEPYDLYPEGWRMLRKLEGLLEKKEGKDLGLTDIAVLGHRSYKYPMHVGIISRLSYGWSIIHANADIGFVKEHGLSDEWISNIHCLFSLPGVTDG